MWHRYVVFAVNFCVNPQSGESAKSKMDTTNHRNVVSFQLQVFSGENLIFCSLADKTDSVKYLWLSDRIWGCEVGVFITCTITCTKYFDGKLLVKKFCKLVSPRLPKL